MIFWYVLVISVYSIVYSLPSKSRDGNNFTYNKELRTCFFDILKKGKVKNSKLFSVFSNVAPNTIKGNCRHLSSDTVYVFFHVKQV